MHIVALKRGLSKVTLKYRNGQRDDPVLGSNGPKTSSLLRQLILEIKVKRNCR